MKRTTYRNGDELSRHGSCDSCEPARINGVFCHESGCPDAWRDYAIECFECGCDFYPQFRYQSVCQGCHENELEALEAAYDAGEPVDEQALVELQIDQMGFDGII